MRDVSISRRAAFGVALIALVMMKETVGFQSSSRLQFVSFSDRITHRSAAISAWDSIKEAVYKSVDAISEASASTTEEEDQISMPVSRGVVVGGYQERSRVAKETAPGKKLLEEYQARALELEQYKKKIAALQYDRNLTPKERAMYALRAEDFAIEEGMLDQSDAQALLQKDSLPANFKPGGPIKFEVDKKILEKEAFARAKRRPDMKARAKKEDLYNIIDSFKEGVEATPEAVTNLVSFVKSVPDKYYGAIEEAKLLQIKAKNTAKDVMDIPNKVSRQVENVQQSVDKTSQNLKVLVGAEKPVPKVPKPPTKLPVMPTVDDSKENEKLAKKALDATGRIGLGAAKLAFSATKGAISLVADQATKAVDKSNTRKNSSSDLKAKSKQLDDDSALIQKQVDDALKIANAALQEAQDDGSSSKKK
jgi:hypothetical protein